MKYFINAVWAESLKLKRTLTFWMIFAIPSFVGILNFLLTLRDDPIIFGTGYMTWENYVNDNINMWSFLMLPLFITLQTALLASTEYSTNQWKHIFAMPVPRWISLAAKWIISLFIIGLGCLVLTAEIAGTGFLLRAFKPGVGFERELPIWILTQSMLRVFLASWLIISFHTWLSLRFHSFAFSVGTGIIAVVGTMVIMNDLRYAAFYPWMLPSNLLRVGNDFNLTLTLSLAGSILVAIVGIWSLIRKEVL
jgi:hypothetical protein